MQKHNVKNALILLQKNLKPGDIINTSGKTDFTKPWLILTQACIRQHQKDLFGKASFYHDTHTEMFFGREKIFSVTAPKTKWEILEHVAKQEFSVYRYTKKDLTDNDINIMLDSANKIIGTKYDYGQLLDIAISQILGYPNIIKYKWFDMGRKRMVCSVGCRAIMEDLRHKLEQDGQETIPRLFNKLNPMYWTEKELKEFSRVDVEATSPAHFANSRWFDGEYRHICCWEMAL